MRKVLQLSLASLLLSLSPSAWAGSGGAEPFNFLFLDANARPVALGGAYTAAAIDANSLLYNPAGLAWVGRNEATFMHNQYFAGITQEYAAFASPLGFGLSVNYLNSGAVAHTTLSNPDGSGFDYTTLNDLAISGGAARKIGESLSLGWGFKFIRESIAGIAAQGYALDLGARYAVPVAEGLSTGLAFQNINIGPSAKFQAVHEELPLNFRWGAAYAFRALENDDMVSLDITKERNQSVLVAIGLESIIAKTLALRLGFNNANTVGTGITGGIGWFYKDLSLDFAVVTYGALGFTHRLSATIRWGDENASSPKGRAPKADLPAPAPRSSEADSAPHFQLAERLIQEKRFNEARNELQAGAKTLSTKDPRRVLFFARMGYIAWLENDVAKAKGDFLRSLDEAAALGVRNSSLAETYAKLGLCYLAENNPQEARKAFEQGLASNPEEATARFLGQQLKKLNASLP